MADTTKSFVDLRKPFPKESVGLLPKPFKRDSPKGNCHECGKFHGLPAAHLDYVGHAAVTDRLLDVDPSWSWEPMATDEDGLPKTDRAGNLWIRLTILGVTRIGVGDGANAKECIGDALRNAAMRFGVALDLWSKEELESVHEGATQANEKPSAEVDTGFDPSVASNVPVATPLVAKSSGTAVGDELSRAKKSINTEMEAQGIDTVFKKKNYIREVVGKPEIDNIIEANLVADALGL